MKVDVLVIGTGPAGSSVAEKCAKAGKKVAIVDSLFGGTCALRGCTPKKAMETVTSAYWTAKLLEEAGFPVTDKFVNWHKLVANKSKFTSLVPARTKAKFGNKDIKTLTGLASFVDKHTVKVGDQKISAKNVVIATGAKPRPLEFTGADYLTNNDGFFALDQLPKKIVIVGGGYIGFEFSHIIAACGSAVTILSNDEMPLDVFDSELVVNLVQATLSKGIDVKLGYEVNKIEKSQQDFEITAQRKDGFNVTFQVDLVIHAAGRVPNIANLAIEKVGLPLNDKNGIAVNKFLQTKTQDHIYALGDVTGHLPFTEIANYEAEIVAHNILEKRRKSVDYNGVPFGVFTHPKLTKVGKSEKELASANIEYTVKIEDYSEFFIERTQLNDQARFKTLIDKQTGKILGASILSTHADDLINLFAVGIQRGMTVEDFQSLLLLYPTATHTAKFLF